MVLAREGQKPSRPIPNLPRRPEREHRSRRTRPRRRHPPRSWPEGAGPGSRRRRRDRTSWDPGSIRRTLAGAPLLPPTRWRALPPRTRFLVWKRGPPGRLILFIMISQKHDMSCDVRSIVRARQRENGKSLANMSKRYMSCSQLMFLSPLVPLARLSSQCFSCFEKGVSFLTQLTAILLAHHPFDAQPDGVVHVRIISSSPSAGCDRDMVSIDIPGASGRSAVAGRAFDHHGSKQKMVPTAATRARAQK
mmetsp:Transcript_39761/g.81781  ORF Transcript_39761/g.81781 Transcript_39761/m.81781 type:complete len:249 (-) Transcript_39761:1586-2332(-)